MDLGQSEASGRDPVAVSQASIAELRAHPRFKAALMSSARSFIDLYNRGGLAGWVLADRARALFGYLVLYLDATRDPADPRSGSTPTRVKETAAQLGICSRGRAAAMLALMRVAGFVAIDPHAGDGRVTRLVPTEKLFELQRRRLNGQFRAIGELMPDLTAALPPLDDRSFQRALVISLSDYFKAGFRFFHYAPDLALFAERTAGMMVLFSLLDGDAADVRGARAASSIAELSRRFRVSRTHILRLLRDAEAQGLLLRVGAAEEGIVLGPRLKDAAEQFFAAMFLLLAAGSRSALAAASRVRGQ